MITDSFFQIGSTHEVCEDYARHQDGLVVLADGCSNGNGGSIDADWGSRFLVMAALKFLTQKDPETNPEVLLPEIWREAKRPCEVVPGLHRLCLLATLLTAQKVDNEIVTMMVGDGVTGGRRRDGTWLVKAINFKPGGVRNLSAPYYLRYAMEEGAHDHYADEFGGQYTTTILDGTLSGTLVKTSGDSMVNRDSYSETTRFPLDEFDLVFIGSDGLESFVQRVVEPTSKYTEAVPLAEVLGAIFDVRHYRSGFLRHQRDWLWKRAFPGSFTQRNWSNADDVSVGVLYDPH